MIKASHVNSSGFHLNRKRTNIRCSSFAQDICNVFIWQLSGNFSCCNFPESDFEKNESSNLKQTKYICQSDSNCLSKYTLNKLIFAHLIIRSTKNKFTSPNLSLRENIDNCLVSEAKTDYSFTEQITDSFITLFRLDCNCLGGGGIFLLREDIPSNPLTIEENVIERFYVEWNLHNSK